MRIVSSMAIFLLACIANAQTVSTYTNQSTSDGVLYSTSVMQTNGWNVPSAFHTYTQYVTITSPTGRSNDCYVSNQVPAEQAYDQTCDTSLSLYDGSGNFDGGSYSGTGTQTADCTVVGRFADVPVQLQAGAQRINAYYYNANSSSQNPNGTYSVLYNRCHPIGSTCDSAAVIYGGPPFPAYALFDGTEIHLANVNYCYERSVSTASNCASPDPVPGAGGGIWVETPKEKS